MNGKRKEKKKKMRDKQTDRQTDIEAAGACSLAPPTAGTEPILILFSIDTH
jgi:hypothetical protein